MSDTPNYRLLEVAFLGPTNTLGARVAIIESAAKEFSHTDHVVMSYDYAIGDPLKQALQHLESTGFNPVCTGYDGSRHTIMCDNWGDNFVELTKQTA